MRQTSGGNLAIDIRLELQILGASIAFGIDWQGDVHLGDVDLHSQSSEALDIGRNGRDIGVQVRDVHLESHAIYGDATLPEIANHGVDRIRLGIHRLRLGLVVKQQSLRIGFVRPAETTLYIGVTLRRAASFELRATRVARSSQLVARSYRDSGLVSPDRAAQLSRAQLVEGLIDHVPRKYLAPVMSDHGLNVFLKNLGELAGSVFSFRQPFWILPVPDERVTANLHAVAGREIHNLVGL